MSDLKIKKNSILNENNNEEYQKISKSTKDEGFLDIARVKILKETRYNNIDSIFKKIKNDINNEMNKNLLNEIKEFKSDDIDFYYSKFKKSKVDDNMTIFIMEDDILMTKFFKSLVLNIIYKELYDDKNKLCKELKEDKDILSDDYDILVEEIDELEKQIKKLKKPDPKLTKRIVNLRNKCIFRRRLNYFLYFIIIFLIYTIVVSKEIMIDQMYTLSYYIKMFSLYTLNFLLEILMMLPYEFFILISVLTYIITKCNINYNIFNRFYKWRSSKLKN